MCPWQPLPYGGLRQTIISIFLANLPPTKQFCEKIYLNSIEFSSLLEDKKHLKKFQKIFSKFVQILEDDLTNPVDINNKILRYVEGQLKGQDRIDFEKLIESDSELRQQVDILIDLVNHSESKNVPYKIRTEIYNMLNIKDESFMDIIIKKSSDIPIKISSTQSKLIYIYENGS